MYKYYIYFINEWYCKYFSTKSI